MSSKCCQSSFLFDELCRFAVAAFSESGTGVHEGEVHFSRLEALDPQKRELLEARFSAPRVGLHSLNVHVVSLRVNL